MIECRYFKSYKAKYPPRCNGGDPCDSCKSKWNLHEAIRNISKPHKNKRKYIEEKHGDLTILRKDET